MRHDDLRRAIDHGLGIEALDVAVLGLEDAAPGSVKLRCPLPSGEGRL
jgi:hypothetical protein